MGTNEDDDDYDDDRHKHRADDTDDDDGNGNEQNILLFRGWVTLEAQSETDSRTKVSENWRFTKKCLQGGGKTTTEKHTRTRRFEESEDEPGETQHEERERE